MKFWIHFARGIVFFRFWKNPGCVPRGSKVAKEPQNAQNGQKWQFWIMTYLLDFSENFPKCEENWYEHKVVIADPGKTPVRVPWGLLGLKNTPFWGFFDDCQKCHFIFRYRGFLWCWIQIYRSQYLKLRRSPIFGICSTSPGDFYG